MAPVKFINKKLCLDASNVCNEGDFVHRIQSLGLPKQDDSIIELPRSPDADGWIDHSFQSSTFMDWLSRDLDKLISKYTVN